LLVFVVYVQGFALRSFDGDLERGSHLMQRAIRQGMSEVRLRSHMMESIENISGTIKDDEEAERRVQ
jgi:hypothetical protein